MEKEIVEYNLVSGMGKIDITFNNVFLGKVLTEKQMMNRVQKLVNELRLFSKKSSFVLYKDVGGTSVKLVSFI